MKYALISQRQMIEIESAFETKRLFATVKDIEVIDKALKILHLLKFSDAVGIIEAELAKPEQEGFYIYKPVLPKGVVANVNQENLPWVYDQEPSSGYSARMLVYTAPPRKPWVGLTDEERHAYTQSPFTEENYRAIEAKLKEKNNAHT
jgi:hypothetical protein